MHKENAVRFEEVLFDLNLFYFFALTFAWNWNMSTSHGNILVLFDQWKMTSHWNIPHGKMSEFVSFTLFGFTLAITQRHFDFESHLNSLIQFDQKNDVRFCFAVWTQT